jgi:hypothetical protein
MKLRIGPLQEGFGIHGSTPLPAPSSPQALCSSPTMIAKVTSNVD